MISVHEAEEIIGSHRPDFGLETVEFTAALGRVLGENLVADRDFPPFNRVTMDGIALRFADFEAGNRTFSIQKTQAAGDEPPIFLKKNHCFEVMTGAALSPAADTIVPYEMLKIEGKTVEIQPDFIKKGQNIHQKGHDRRAGDTLLFAGKRIGPPEISMAAAIGKTHFGVQKKPRVVVLSSGDELVEPTATPLPFQIRRSNSFAIQAALRTVGIEAEMRHLPDDLALTRSALADCLARFEVLILSGGVSAGKFDFVPQALVECGVERRFHKVQQRPGKPFWFGTFGKNGVVFALPGNPVSTFMCFVRFVLPWLEAAPPVFAVLENDYFFEPPLQYFLQVKLRFDESGKLLAAPLTGNGSGDFANLLEADAFLELPAVEQSAFQKGAVFRVWPYRNWV